MKQVLRRLTVYPEDFKDGDFELAEGWHVVGSSSPDNGVTLHLLLASDRQSEPYVRTKDWERSLES